MADFCLVLSTDSEEQLILPYSQLAFDRALRTRTRRSIRFWLRPESEAVRFALSGL